jgi:hypothetical protein
MTLCAAPGCENPATRAGERGRRPLYCSPECRPSAYKPRSRRIAVQVGHEQTEEGARPFGPVWFVELQRAAKSVVIADGLSRPSADHLARQLTQLLGDNDETKGGEPD